MWKGRSQAISGKALTPAPFHSTLACKPHIRLPHWRQGSWAFTSLHQSVIGQGPPQGDINSRYVCFLHEYAKCFWKGSHVWAFRSKTMEMREECAEIVKESEGIWLATHSVWGGRSKIFNVMGCYILEHHKSLWRPDACIRLLLQKYANYPSGQHLSVLKLMRPVLKIAILVYLRGFSEAVLPKD